MSDTDRFSLRPEARPVPYWKHPRRAKEALELIIRALKTSADNIKESAAIEADPSLDPNRTSQIFFVSGEPGSGKSTLYWTLRAMLSSKGEKVYSKKYPDPNSLHELQGIFQFLSQRS